MKKTAFKALLLLLMTAALLLSACGEAAAPPPEEDEEKPAPTAAPALPEGAVPVSTVDELLSAIAPNATIVLQEGEYDLTAAADYGEEDLRGLYSWELLYGGCELSIRNVNGLRLIGQGEVSILTRPRYAQVLRFVDCEDLHLEGLTLGHTLEPGACSGGVLDLESCVDVSLDSCRLFGCGTIGLSASGCESVTLKNCRIDSCSTGAVDAGNCRDIRLEDCQLCDSGLSRAADGKDLIRASRCRGFALVNCEISGNRMQHLLHNSWSEQTVMLGCRVEQNRVLDTMFLLEGRSVTVDKCSFQRRSSESYYSRQNSLFALDPDGAELISFDLDHMQLARAEYSGPAADAGPEPDREQQPDGSWKVRVSTADELLAAIAPHTTVVMAPGDYVLSQTADYGSIGGDWYGWTEEYDGYSLTLINVEGLKLVGAGREETRIVTEPRYAAVMSFRGCEDLSLSGFTAGHSPDAGACSGNVLDFESCRTVSLEDCGLFGCGVEGISAWKCSGLSVKGSEIYECSYAGASFSACSGLSFEGCSIHDCDEGNDRIFLNDGSLSWDGTLLGPGILLFGPDGYRGTESFPW